MKSTVEIHGGKQIELEHSKRVLPPDDASRKMAEQVVSVLLLTRLGASKFAEATKNSELKPQQPLRILDLGSGTGVLGIAAVRLLKSLKMDEKITLIAIDNDPKAVRSTSRNYAKYVSGCVNETRVIRGSWDDPLVWESIGDVDLVLCNPPYLIEEDDPTIRSGYENVNRAAMYVPTQEDAIRLYHDLLTKSREICRAWGTIALRLPRLTSHDINPEARWGLTLAMKASAENNVETRDNSTQLSELISVNVYESPYDTEGAPPRRPLQTLTVDLFPVEYPWLGGFNDPVGAHWWRTHKILDDRTYEQLLSLAGYNKSQPPTHSQSVMAIDM